MSPDEDGPDNIRRGVRQAFDTIAHHFDKTRVFAWPQIADFVKGLESGLLTLDVGCGNGRHSSLLAEQGLDVVGIDFSMEMVKLASDRPGISVVRGEALSLPFKDASFDLVVHIATLHHVPTSKLRQIGMDETARILKSGGRTFVSVWAREQERFKDVDLSDTGRSTGLLEPGDIYVDWTFHDGRKVPRFHHLFASGELEGLVRASGLEIGKTFSEADNHFVIARKK
jgi:ubiquinone/menaquinone biosynthesis C-methylase UbiE